MKPWVVKLSGTLSAGLLLCSLSAWSQDSNSKTSTSSRKKAQSKPVAKAQSTKKTVGELLQQADRGGQIQAAAKQRAALPTVGPLAANQKIAPQELAQIKPPRTSTFLENGADDRAKLENYLDQQIEELYKLVKKFASSSQRGELWLRLAELYVEKSDLIENRAQSKYDEQIKAFHAKKITEKPKLDTSQARVYNKKAIQLYEYFLRDFPKDNRVDQALFFLGYNYFELGNIHLGLNYYNRLTKEFPSSPFIIESHFALAEYYFENEKWKDAVGHYYEVAKHPHHRLASFSMYKLAWCEYRSNDVKTAIPTLEKLIARNRQADPNTPEGKKISKQRLEKEAIRDLVLFYSDDRRPEDAVQYFENLAGSEADYYLEKLAYLYVDRGNREGSRVIFTHLINKNPTSPKAFDFKYQLTQVFANTPQTKAYREQLYGWVHDYGPAGAWYKANQTNTTLIENSNRLRETTLKNWILTQHQSAQNTRGSFSQTLADEGYKVYLSEFTYPAQVSVPDMHFYYGELLYDMEKFAEAGVQYQWVVDNAPNSKFAAKSAENILLAFEHSLPKDSEIAATVGNSTAPVPFQERAEAFVKAAKWYLEKFPKGPKAAELKFRVGRLYYQHNQFDQAIPYFKEIVQSYPNTKYAEYSANLLLDSYNLKKDYAGLEKTGQELLGNSTISNSAAGADIRNVVEKAQFKKAQDLEINKDYLASADQYQAFAVQNPKSPLVYAAIFNAAVNYERAGENQKAINDHRSILAGQFPDPTGFKTKSRRLIAKLYLEAGMLNEAAQAFKGAGQEAGKDPIAANLYFDAGVNYELLGENAQAVEAYEAYLARTPKQTDKAEAYYKLGQIYLREGKNKATRDMFQSYINVAPVSEKWIECSYWSWTLAPQKEKAQWHQRVMTGVKNSIGLTWVAKIALNDVQESFQEFKNLRIPADPARQSSVVQKKIGLLAELNKKLANIIKMNSPDEIVAALVLSGKASALMGEAIVRAPLPQGLKPDEEKAYRAGVQKVADPFYQKAKESLQGAIDKAFELEVYSLEVTEARRELSRLGVNIWSDRAEAVREDNLSNWTVNP